MKDELEEKPNSEERCLSSKTALFDTFNKLRKWREDQLQQFRNMQLYKSQMLLQRSLETQKHFEQLVENTKAKSPVKLSDNEYFPLLSPEKSESSISLQESSITGHLLHCLNDSSSSSPSLNEGKVGLSDENISPFAGNHSFYDFLQEKENCEQSEKLEKDVSVNPSVIKPKRPFLRKGSGLIRYMPRKTTTVPKTTVKRDPVCKNKSPVSQKRIYPSAIKALKLKSALHSDAVSSEQPKHIRFNDPDPQAISREQSNIPSQSNVDTDVNSKIINSDPITCPSDTSDHQEDNIEIQEDKNPKCNESLTSEKELAEFEMLESCAQNSSFNSDSSIVQRVLHGKPIEPQKFDEKMFSSKKRENGSIFLFNESKDGSHVTVSSAKTNGNQIPVSSAKTDFSKCLEDVQTRKQQLQQMILDINPRIESLQKEIGNPHEDGFDKEDKDASDRCSTPVSETDFQNIILAPDGGGKQSPLLDSSKLINHENVDISDTDEPHYKYLIPSDNMNDSAKIVTDAVAQDQCINHMENVPPDEGSLSNERPEVSIEPKQIFSEKSKFKEKIIELEKEIEIYQEHNAKLSIICKERKEIVKKLQKEQEDFQKYKEVERKKLEAELEEERKQIRRQKETFIRYQKLRRDNPSRKEREELSALRQEVEKLQEELKRQNIKNNNDIRRLKNQLINIEKERDNLRLDNIRFQEQCEDLLSALKARNKKWKHEVNSKNSIEENADNLCKASAECDVKNTCCEKETQEPQEMIASSEMQSINKQISSKSDAVPKPKVHFNLVPEYFRNVIKSQNSETDEDDVSEISSDIDMYNENKENLTAETDEGEYKEINRGDNLERIYTSGEREIIFQSGTRKIISADGKTTKYIFYNGDVKEIFPDKREVYKYDNGVIDTHFPDGLEVTEFPNGQIQRRYPDGLKEVKFLDGTTHRICPDGSEEIHAANGTILTLGIDGTETIEYRNGHKEIRTSSFKRREYPDGSVKIIYHSGRQETRYANGRIRIKDKEGKLIVDTKYLDGQRGKPTHSTENKSHHSTPQSVSEVSSTS